MFIKVNEKGNFEGYVVIYDVSVCVFIYKKMIS